MRSVDMSRSATRESRPTISAFLEVVQGAFGDAEVQPVWETVDLVAADATPFKDHLKWNRDEHMSRLGD